MCDVHGWFWADDDEMGCPLCFGINAERERINGIIEQFIENSDYPEVVSSLQWLQDVIKGENK